MVVSRKPGLRRKPLHKCSARARARRLLLQRRKQRRWVAKRRMLCMPGLAKGDVVRPRLSGVKLDHPGMDTREAYVYALSNTAVAGERKLRLFSHLRGLPVLDDPSKLQRMGSHGRVLVPDLAMPCMALEVALCENYGLFSLVDDISTRLATLAANDFRYPSKTVGKHCMIYVCSDHMTV